MAILTRLRRGWRVGVRSVRVAASAPRLLALPALNVAVLLGLALAAVAFLATVPEGPMRQQVTALGVPGVLVALVVVRFLVALVWTFFAVALVHCVALVLRGQPPRIRDGLATAWRVRRAVVTWAVVTTGVAVLLRLLERTQLGRRTVRRLLGATWSAGTIFVVPVLALEGGGVRPVVRQSATAVRETWGETAGATVGASVVLVAMTLGLTALVAVALIAFGNSPVALGVITVLTFLLVVLQVPVAQTIGGVVKTVLYVYAREGAPPAQFDDIDVEFAALFEGERR